MENENALLDPTNLPDADELERQRDAYERRFDTVSDRDSYYPSIRWDHSPL